MAQSERNLRNEIFIRQSPEIYYCGDGGIQQPPVRLYARIGTGEMRRTPWREAREYLSDRAISPTPAAIQHSIVLARNNSFNRQN